MKKRRAGRRPKRSGTRQNAPGAMTATNLQAGFKVRAMPFFGYHVRKKLNYYTFGSVASGANNLAGAYVFSANGMFDPDVTGTGGQPMSFDQGMTFFNHYTVHRATIKVTIHNESTGLRVNAGLFVSGSSSVTTSVEQLLENGDGAVEGLSYAGAMGSSATFTRTLDVGKFQDVRDVLDDPNMRGDSASNPTEQAYFHIVVYNLQSIGAASLYFETVITYDATFHEPKKGSLS